MAKTPEAVAEFLRGERLAVAGVSRSGNQPANAIFKRLRDSGHEVFPINPKTSEVEGVECFPNVADLPSRPYGLVIVTHPEMSADIVRECADQGVDRVWLHRSFGQGSVSDEAVRECAARGINCIVGGCPMMFSEPVDFGHKCMRWWLQWRGHVPR